MQVRAFERYIPLKKKGNVTCDFQQFGILISVDSDKPLQPPFRTLFGQWLNTHRIFKRLEKALIRLRVCAGWSEPLLVSHTTLLEISCHGSNGRALFVQVLF